jgi:hypothetical protein
MSYQHFPHLKNQIFAMNWIVTSASTLSTLRMQLLGGTKIGSFILAFTAWRLII